ncbi:MAG: ATP phosphoribosyltransferase regulatory subunit [Lachnospiraceae bacterium]|nr:ATP phosphoribosyltransferase regulatory subunit [Lachnospiraceae bacterium]
MKNQLLHTPEGVRDIYNKECARKLAVQENIHEVFASCGYKDIQTPTFEFFDIFNKERGSVASREMFKFFDRDGNTLVLRPDITPSVARAATKYFMDEDMPIRLCYMGNTYINNSSYQGRLKEVTQLGCELIGDATVDADAEIIAMVVQCMMASGLKDFQVQIGQVDYFNGLVEEAGIDEDVQEQLRELIENKNYFGVDELLTSINIDDKTKKSFLGMADLFGGFDVLAKAKENTDNEISLKAVERLEKLYKVLEYYKLEERVSFELDMLGHYKYYTGIIFRAYTYGTGDAIVTGGRYDNLIAQFGKDAPSVGFAIVIDRLMLALSSQKIEAELPEGQTIILYEQEKQQEAISAACKLRTQGIRVELIRKFREKTIENYLEYANNYGASTIYYLGDEANEVSLRDGSMIQVDEI